MRALASAFLLTVLAACVDDPDDLAATEQAIQDGSLASQFWRDRAAKLGNCTATVISRRHAVTALHCAPEAGDPIRFYDDGPGADGVTREIEAVTFPPGTGVDGDDEDWTDSSGDIADLAVIRFDRPLRTSTVATLAWAYPGIDEGGLKVGAGKHEGNANPTGILRTKYDETWSDTDDSGGFYTSEYALDGGDSGGGFYDGSHLLGVTHGGHLLGVWRGRYTSVPHHLGFLLDAIDWAWAGGPVENKRRLGPIHSIVFGGQNRCKYACERTPGCFAFDHQAVGAVCTMLSSVTSTTSSPTHTSALK